MPDPGSGAGPDAVPHAHDARVILYSRTDCHLCEQARAVVASVCAEAAADWAEIDVDTDQRLRELFTEQVPVTFVDGRQHDFWRVDADRLTRALAGPA